MNINNYNLAISSRLSSIKKIVSDLGVGKCLEISPLFLPILLKENSDVTYCDYLSYEELVDREKDNPSIIRDGLEIKKIDFILRPGTNLKDYVGNTKFDQIISSHVLEHTPDFISYLIQMQDVLAETGKIIAVLPLHLGDQEYFQPTSNLGMLLESYIFSHNRPTFSKIFNYYRNSIDYSKDFGKVNSKSRIIDFNRPHSFDTAIYDSIKGITDYVDSHCWCFTPEILKDIIDELNMVGLIKLKVDSYYEIPTNYNNNNRGSEFSIVFSFSDTKEQFQSITYLNDIKSKFKSDVDIDEISNIKKQLVHAEKAWNESLLAIEILKNEKNIAEENYHKKCDEFNELIFSNHNLQNRFFKIYFSILNKFFRFLFFKLQRKIFNLIGKKKIETHFAINNSVMNDDIYALFNNLNNNIIGLIDNRINLKLDNFLNWKIPIVYSSSDYIFLHNEDSQRILLDPLEPFMTHHFLEHRVWEPHVQREIDNLLPVSGNFIDIGANIGLHTLFAAKKTGKYGKIFSIEAHPRLFKILKSNIENNGYLDFVSLFQFAASNLNNEHINFEYFVEHPGMSGVKISDEVIDYFKGSKEIIKVPTVTIDYLCNNYSFVPNLIKIDVEGYEYNVLLGALDIIKFYSPSFIIEFDKKMATDIFDDFVGLNIFNLFSSNGYSCFRIDQNSLTELALSDFLLEIRGDYIFKK